MPTREAVETIIAWNDEMALPLVSAFFSTMFLNMSLMKRTCTKPVRMVKYTPANTSKITRM